MYKGRLSIFYENGELGTYFYVVGVSSNTLYMALFADALGIKCNKIILNLCEMQCFAPIFFTTFVGKTNQEK